jgi:hypothetical protein
VACSGKDCHKIIEISHSLAKTYHWLAFFAPSTCGVSAVHNRSSSLQKCSEAHAVAVFGALQLAASLKRYDTSLAQRLLFIATKPHFFCHNFICELASFTDGLTRYRGANDVLQRLRARRDSFFEGLI